MTGTTVRCARSQRRNTVRLRATSCRRARWSTKRSPPGRLALDRTSRASPRTRALGGQPVDETIALLKKRVRTQAVVELEAEILAELITRDANQRRVSDAEPYAICSLELAERSLPRCCPRARVNDAGDKPVLARSRRPQRFNDARSSSTPSLRVDAGQRQADHCLRLDVHGCGRARPRALLEEARRVGEANGDITIFAVLWLRSVLQHLNHRDWPRALALAQRAATQLGGRRPS